MNLKSLIDYYLPVELVKETKAKMFDTLLDILNKDGIPEAVQGSLVENVFSFVTTPQQVELILQWNQKGYVFH